MPIVDIKITEGERQRFVEVDLQSADEAGLSADAAFCKALASRVDFGSHVARQNPNAKTDAELHPCGN